MVNQEILISYKEIINKYYDLDEEIKCILAKLYGENINCVDKNFNISKVITVDENLIEKKIKDERLNDFIGKAGVYVFLDSKMNPVYIGYSSTIRQRLGYQLKGLTHGASTLLKNIKTVEKLFDKNLKFEGKSIKDIFNEYISFLIVIDYGKKNEENVRFAKSLETILISLFNSKYNL